MSPEAADAIIIADKHLRGQSAERRMALALEIQDAIIRHAGTIAADVIRETCEKLREQQQQKH